MDEEQWERGMIWLGLLAAQVLLYWLLNSAWGEGEEGKKLLQVFQNARSTKQEVEKALV